MTAFTIRTMCETDRHEVADLIYISLNHWYQTHGCPPIMTGTPAVADVFFQVYEALDPGCGIVAVHGTTGRLMGSCFYHPRPTHVSLGIMNVHPNYFGCGAGRALLEHIIEVARAADKPLRLVQSALNLDSFSLYNKAGLVPRSAYQDMYVKVPAEGLCGTSPTADSIRDATPDDVAAMAALDREVGFLEREQDFRYFVKNDDGFWHVSVIDGIDGQLEGFMVSCGHPAMNMLGPCVTRTEAQAGDLIERELDHYRDRMPVFLIPVECSQLVQRMYRLGARNCELHFCQVLGEYKPPRGVSMPTFLPESG